VFSKKNLVVCQVDEPSPIAYLNVYEQGDAWIKTKGCEDCSLENRKLCCGSCPMFTDKGCFFHLEQTNSKPFRCVVIPAPNDCLKWCALEFKCIKGNNEGKIRKVKEPGNIFH